MLRQNLLLVVLTGAMLTSCAVIKDTPQSNLVSLKKADFKKLNGEFVNYPTDAAGNFEKDYMSKDFSPMAFWTQVKGERWNEHNAESQKITLEFRSPRRGVVKLWENDSLIKQRKIRGRIRHGYFYRRPGFVVVPFFPLVFGYHTYQYRIGLTPDALVVDARWNYWIFIIAAGGYSRGNSHSIFNRTNG